jgi:hypothetical protein
MSLIAGGTHMSVSVPDAMARRGKQRKYPTALDSSAPQFPTSGTEYSEAQVFWVAKHGIRHTGMFFNGAWDSDEELRRVAAFIKRMNRLPQAVRDELAKKPN